MATGAVARGQSWCAQLPAPPDNEADALVRVTWGDWPDYLGEAPWNSMFVVNVAAGDAGVTPTPPIEPGTYTGWCFDVLTDINPDYYGTWYGGWMFASCDPVVAFNAYLPDHPNVKVDAATWKKINYVINHRYDPTLCAGAEPVMWEIQRVIYILMGQTPPTDAGYPPFRPSVEECLLQAANDHAADWQPQCGDKMAVIYNIDANWDDAVPDVQLLFLEVPVPCVTLENHVVEDVNGDGEQNDPPSAGINGVVVNLYDCDGQPVLDGDGNPVVTVTNDDAEGNPGYYAFPELAPGCYQLSFEPPDDFTFPADSAGGTTTTIDLPFGDPQPDWNINLVKPASLGDLVWHDWNANGHQDPGEPGLAGLTVELVSCGDGQVVASLVTDDEGQYLFTGIAPADYQVRVGVPSGYLISPQDQEEAEGEDSDADATGLTGCVTLVAEELQEEVDVGLFRKGTVGGLVWLDENANGVREGADTGVWGLTVDLMDGAGAVLGSTLTDADGRYTFGSLNPGEYLVRILPAGGWRLSPPNQGDDAFDSDADPETGRTEGVVLLSGATINGGDAGVYAPATVGGMVWHDANANGLRESEDGGQPGVAVELLDGGGSPVAAAISAADGSYAFGDLTPGSYQVRLSAGEGWRISPANQGDDALDSDVDEATGLAEGVTLVSGATEPGGDAGIYQPASVGNLVWLDANANGRQDAEELGMAEVAVELHRCDGSLVTTSATDGSGHYGFSDLTPGDYEVRVILPEGYEASPPHAGTDGALDSDADALGSLGCVTLTSGQQELALDAGLFERGAIGDFVWNDGNADGVQDAEEPGISGVEVTLLYCDGSIVSSATTDADGHYQFDALIPGDYRVRVTPPSGYEISPADQGGNDGLDSDVDATGASACVTLGSGENLTQWDAGLFQKATIGDLVWIDRDANGVQDDDETGLGGVGVEIRSCGGDLIASTTTSADGSYRFSDLNPGNYEISILVPGGYHVSPKDQGGDDAVDSDADATGGLGCTQLTSGANDPAWDVGLYRLASVGDLVWEDLNGDGVQDAGEPGMGGVVVELFDCQGTRLDATTTDGSGGYQFGNLAPGDYLVRVVIPEGLEVTSADQGEDDALDSDAGEAGAMVCLTLESGEIDGHWDAGLVRPASLGDFVWNDQNENGAQDAGEPGVEGVTVELYRCDDDSLVATTLTDSGGHYAFETTPGVYRLRFTALPPGYQPSTAISAGVPVELDNDADPTTGETGCLTLASGQSDTTWDAAVIEQDTGETCQATTLTFNGSSSLDGPDGNVRVFTDGLVSVKVTGFSRNKTTGAWTPAYVGIFSGGLGVTDSGEGSGTGNSHTLDNLDREDYLLFEFSQPVVIDRAYLGYVVSDSDLSVWIGTQPDPYHQHLNLNNDVLASLTFNEHSATASDSPRWAELNAGEVKGNVLVLAASTTDAVPVDEFKVQQLDLCATAIELAEVGDRVWADGDGNGRQDAGEPGLEGVAVVLNGTDLFGESVTRTQMTDVEGRYAFVNVVPGTYTVTFGGLPGMARTSQNVGADEGDSDADPTSGQTQPFVLVAGQVDATVDAGLVPWSGGGGCTLTIGYWKNHPQAIGPLPIFLGTSGGSSTLVVNTVNKAVDVLGQCIYGSPGNGITKLYAQLLATKLNLLQGADPTAVQAVIEASDAFLAEHAYGAWGGLSPAEQGLVLSWKSDLDDFNNGIIGPGHCNETEPLATVGDRVWEDTNRNGVQDPEETGVDGIRVELFRAVGEARVAETVTANGGSYEFEVAPGDYFLRFSELPSGYRFSPSVPSVAADPDDSDAQVSNGRTDTFTLVSGEVDRSWDAGIHAPAESGCLPATFVFEGNSRASGPAGNIQTFSDAGISVKVSAFSRTKNGGEWAPAYLGVYSGGLGVTDTSEGNGSGNRHTVDNLGRDNFLLFEFSQPVAVDGAQLGYVSTDSDLSVWIGTANDPFANHLSLSDAVLSGLGTQEENQTSSGRPRWADLNTEGVVGNVLVIAAKVNDPNPRDQFKLQRLEVCAPPGAAVNLVCPDDAVVPCGGSSDPSATGEATATSTCAGEVTVVYTDELATESWQADGEEVVVLEAEDHDGAFPGEANAWNLQSGDERCSRGRFVEASADQGRMATDTSGPRLDFQVNLPRAGTWYVWMRGAGPNGEGNSCHVGVDGNRKVETMGNGNEWAGGDWKWANYCGGNKSNRAKFTVESAGPHTLNLWMREDGFRCDKILLCTSPGDPAGIQCGSGAEGPAADDNNTVILRTWTAMDACGNQASCTQTITLERDTTPPLVMCPPDAVVPCGGSTDPSATGEAIATDECSAEIVITYSDETSTEVRRPSGDQVVVVECEANDDEAEGRGQRWDRESTLGGSSRSGYRKAGSDNGLLCADTSGPRLDYRIDFPEAGTWYVWVRASGPDSEGNSCHIGLNGAKQVDTMGNDDDWSDGQWRWVNYRSANRSRRAKITVDSPGVHTVNLWMREDGLRCDKILLCTTPDDPPGIHCGSGEMGPEAASEDQVILRTWTATDASGNRGTCTQTIRVLTCEEPGDPGETGGGGDGEPEYPGSIAAAAQASCGQVLVSWITTGTCTSYTVKRSTTSSGPYEVLATGLTDVSYADAAVESGLTYYYVVARVGGGQEVGESAETQATPVCLPSPWSSEDIGQTGAKGSGSLSGEEFMVKGSGADIWNSSDAFHFVYQNASGDCTILARVTSIGNSHEWAKAGVMIRESLSDNAKHASVFLTPENGVAFQGRSKTGGNSWNDNKAGKSAPFWVKVVRRGSTFTGYWSKDGDNWKELDSQTISMASNVYIGLAVTSHSEGAVCTATMTEVYVKP